ncbi:MAG: hypothetical protein LW815_09465 [Chitinophagaceae bacterium]|jgi:hypothetical protein|nr:hypothetical protein [Chitinophagaceae bacterium]
MMFLSKDDLKLAYGVDMHIGETYVNRQVPQDNLYWKNRKIYVPGAPGYTFMPIFSDLLYRCGADREQLIGEDFLQLSEAILHSAARLEHKQLGWEEHVAEVIALVAPAVIDNQLFNALKAYAGNAHPIKTGDEKLGTAFPSLNRADSYLFSLVIINSPSFDVDKAIRAWYALMTYFLILDDLADIREDLLNGEENVLIDAGLNDAGADKITEMIDESIATMNLVNPVMANRIEHKKSLINLHEIIRSIRHSAKG